MGLIKLLIVDDSLLMQRVLSDILQTDPEVTVIGVARNGEEALSKVATLHPDVVTMDVEMPRMDGLAAVQEIMKTNPVPVVMVSALTQREAEIALKALDYGAVDYVPKPSGSISLNMDSVKDELISKIKTAASANVAPVRAQNNAVSYTSIKCRNRVISMAASTGGPPAITSVLRALPADVPPMLIVQHMPKGITALFAQGLDNKCKFRVKEAEDGDKIQAGLALVAPGGFHMMVTAENRVCLTVDPPINYVRPSADVTMIAVAEKFRSKNIGVILTGMGSDGAKGIKAIKEKGGFTIAQDKRTSVVYGMPFTAFQTGCVDIVAPLDRIPNEIMKACSVDSE